MKGYFRSIIRQKIADGQSAPVPDFTRRDITLPRIPHKALAIVGMRRSGKTTFLWQILADYLKEGVDRNSALYFNFEDDRLAGMELDDLDVLVEEFYRIYPEGRSGIRSVFFLDEVQVVSGWERFVRRLLDTETLDIFLSGSSARLLSREVATSMRGRAMEVRVFPFSFREYLRHQDKEPAALPERWNKADRTMVERSLREYLLQGGFPETVGAARPERMELLRSYVDVALLRDVIERYAVSHPVALRWMVRQLLGNAAGSFSVNKFYGDLKSQGFSVGKDTLHEYLGYLEDAFLLKTVSISTDSERRRMVNPRKVYPIDPGLIALYDRSGKSNTGHALETAVFLELERRGADIRYVRTSEGYEVDFFVSDVAGSKELVQVCADLDDPVVRDREIRALHKAAAEYPGAKLCVITLESVPRITFPKDIVVVTASHWFLSRNDDTFSPMR